MWTILMITKTTAQIWPNFVGEQLIWEHFSDAAKNQMWAIYCLVSKTFPFIRWSERNEFKFNSHIRYQEPMLPMHCIPVASMVVESLMQDDQSHALNTRTVRMQLCDCLDGSPEGKTRSMYAVKLVNECDQILYKSVEFGCKPRHWFIVDTGT